jgi:hypothetical protein
MPSGIFLRKSTLRTGLYTLCLGILFAFNYLRLEPHYMNKANPELLNILFNLCVIVFLSSFVRDRKRLNMIVKSFVLSSTIVSSYGIYEGLSMFFLNYRPDLPFPNFGAPEIAIKPYFADYSLVAVESFFYDRNLTGCYVLVGLLLSISWLRNGNSPTGSKLSRLIVLFIPLHIICIILTLSRSIMFLTLVCLFAYFLVYFRPRNRVFLLGTMSLVLGILIVGNSLALFQAYVATISERFRVGISTEYVRAYLANQGIQEFLHAPFIGFGMEKEFPLPRSHLYSTHIFYLTFLAKYGVVGLSIFCLFIWPVIKGAFRVFFQPKMFSFDLDYALSCFAVLSFQLVYDNLFSEPIWVAFSILYTWSMISSRAYLSRGFLFKNHSVRENYLREAPR